MGNDWKCGYKTVERGKDNPKLNIAAAGAGDCWSFIRSVPVVHWDSNHCNDFLLVGWLLLVHDAIAIGSQMVVDT